MAFAQSHMDMLSLEEAALIRKYLAEKSAFPVALHLDHGQDEEVIKEAIRLELHFCHDRCVRRPA